MLMALHLPAHGPSVLAEIVNRGGRLPAVTAEQDTVLEPGHIYVAVPRRHLVTHDHRVVLSDGPTESGHRPANNALFPAIPRFATGPATEELGPPSGFSCPDCHGSLHVSDNGHYSCQVEHAWNTEALLAARDRETDKALAVLRERLVDAEDGPLLDDG
ncbi:MAG: chemotaxis protein CheB [Actinomycetota bacterium]|nr:chemotaxis protein CheB [Actinomycetota bacterium]